MEAGQDESVVCLPISFIHFSLLFFATLYYYLGEYGSALVTCELLESLLKSPQFTLKIRLHAPKMGFRRREGFQPPVL